MKQNSKGQTLLIIILILAVVLTISLSVASRTISDISLSSREDESARAFSAAEAGVEQSLLKGTGTFTLQGNLTEQDSFTASAEPLASGGEDFTIPTLMLSGDTASVWLVEHNSNGEIICDTGKPCFTGDQLKICWGNVGTPGNEGTTPAILASILYLTSDTNYSTSRMARAVIDPNTTRHSQNNFNVGSSGPCSIGGQNYAFSGSLQFSDLGVTLRPTGSNRSGAQYVSLRTLYNTNQAHPVGVSGNGNILPVQGSKVTAVGTSGSSVRSLEVFRQFSDIPPIFHYALFSGSGGIVK